jgi:hypothetical protein
MDSLNQTKNFDVHKFRKNTLIYVFCNYALPVITIKNKYIIMFFLWMLRIPISNRCSVIDSDELIDTSKLLWFLNVCILLNVFLLLIICSLCLREQKKNIRITKTWLRNPLLITYWHFDGTRQNKLLKVLCIRKNSIQLIWWNDLFFLCE